MSIQTNDTALSKLSLRMITLLTGMSRRLKQPAIASEPVAVTKPPIVITEYGYSNGAVLLNLVGQLNVTSSDHLLSQIQAVYNQGARRLILNLEQVSEIELSGIFALGNIARLYAGLPLIDAEDGWHALKEMSQSWPPNLPTQVILVTPNRTLQTKLSQTHLHPHLPVYDDLVAALHAFR